MGGRKYDEVGILNLSRIMDIQQHYAQSYFIGQGFGEIMERLDWIGRKLDGEEMDTSYKDIMIKHLKQKQEQLEHQLLSRSEFDKCCCEVERKI